MRIEDPALLGLLALIPLYIWLLRGAWRRPVRALRLPRWATDEGSPRRSARVRTLPYLHALRVLALILVVVAIARPQRSQIEAVTPAEGIDIVLTVDVSSSMIRNQLDDETRLEAARRVARDFVERRGEDRVGLVIFQSESLVLSPLTLDLDAIDSLLEVSVLSGLMRDGTALGLALADSVDLLRDSDATSRIVVAITDGQDNIREVAPAHAAAAARALGVRIYSIGLPANEEGRGVNELGLIYVAQETSGRYFRAIDLEQLEEAYEEIESLETTRVGEETFRRFDDLAPWLLLPALGLLLIEVAAAASWWRRAP